MSKVKASLTVSVDRYVAGPNQSREDPLGGARSCASVEAPGVTHLKYRVVK
jgi:hypothetical protein